MNSRAKEPGRSAGEGTDSAVPSLSEIDDRLALDDFSGALELALERQRKGADDDKTTRVIRRCERVLREMYVGKLGGSSRRLKVVMAPDKMRWLALDHRAGFLVSRIVVPTTVEDLLDICGMPPLEALEVLCDLKSQEVIELVDDE